MHELLELNPLCEWRVNAMVLQIIDGIILFYYHSAIKLRSSGIIVVIRLLGLYFDHALTMRMAHG